DRETFQSLYEGTADIFIFSKYYSTDSVASRYYMKPPVEVLFIMSEVLTDNDRFKETILPALTKIYDQTGFSDKVQMEHSPLLSWIVAGSREQPITVRM